ncbi:MAG: hypothetical protein ACXVBY_18855, partial [Isosphaeraceae bacterium]
FGRVVQEAVFQDACFQPLINHPSDHTIRDSLVKEVPEERVRDRIERRHARLPITKTMQIRSSSLVNGMYLKGAGSSSSGAS